MCCDVFVDVGRLYCVCGVYVVCCGGKFFGLVVVCVCVEFLVIMMVFEYDDEFFLV